MQHLLTSIPVELYAFLATTLVTILLGRKSQLDSWSSANPRIAGLLKVARSVTFDALMLRQGLVLLVAGRLPKDLQDPPKPPDPPSRSGTGKGEHIIVTPSEKPPPSNVESLRAFSAALRKPGAPLVCLMCVALVTGCAGSLESARKAGAAQREAGSAEVAAASPERCDKLDSRRQWFGAATKGLGLLAGGSGITSIATDDKDTRIALAVGAAVAGAGAAVFAYMTEQTDESWAENCSVR